MKTKKRLLLACTSVAALVIAGFLITSHLRYVSELITIPPDSRQVLAHSQQFILYSLYPEPSELKSQEKKGGTYFHNYLILGQTLVTNPKTRANLVTAFYKGIGESNGDEKACFNPQFGIRAVREGQTVDLVICYACLQIEIYDSHGFRGTTTSDSPLPMFSRVLSDAGVKLAGR